MRKGDTKRTSTDGEASRTKGNTKKKKRERRKTDKQNSELKSTLLCKLCLYAALTNAHDLTIFCLTVVFVFLGFLRGMDDLGEFLREETVLHEHQRVAVKWMVDASHACGGVILADEMGLGKTLSVLALASCVKTKERSKFRAMVVAPLSVAPNWVSECHRFTSLSCCLLLGNADQVCVHVVFDFNRSSLLSILFLSKRANVHAAFVKKPSDILVTTYEFARESWLDSVPWTLLVVDEAHKLKNRETVLYKSLFGFPGFRVLLTGTPVQNNLNELYSLLHFASASDFGSADEFLGLNESSRRDLLRRFMLRRLLSDVAAVALPPRLDLALLCPMSRLQRSVYLAALRRDWAALKGGPKTGGGGGGGGLASVMMNLRKATAHPYLFDGVEPQVRVFFVCSNDSLSCLMCAGCLQQADGSFAIGEHLIRASGKLRVLDVLLRKFEQQKQRVLLFSTMTRVLDILQDYLVRVAVCLWLFA